MYDVIIIGSGPAGMSAALNLQLHNKNICWFGSRALSQKVEKSEKIANYPGLPMISGPELNRAFADQIDKIPCEIQDKLVTLISPMGDHFMVLAENDVYESKTVLLAIGSVPAKGIPGEDALLGKGVSYCATCDGFLYRGKTIAVQCTSRQHEHEVTYLAELAERVYLHTKYKSDTVFPGNVETLSSPIVSVLGENRVSAIATADGTSYPVEGLFCLRDAVSPAKLLSGLAMDGPHIAVNRAQETNFPGCFAAGDCTGLPYQVAKAVGEGNVAAHSIISYLARQVK